jgi:DNA-binding LacI/PurR family transcriptional regulator
MPIKTSDNTATKHARLAQEMRHKIHAGALSPGDRLPSFSQLRTRYGVTLSTIEKALSTLEREGLIERFHGKGVFVLERSKATKTLGFVCGKQGTSAWGLYWVAFMDGVQQAAHAAGYEILLLNPALSSDWQDKVDGAIFHEMTLDDCLRTPAAVPQVNVLSSVPGLTCVVTDEFGGMQQAVRHLLEMGHRRIAYLVDDSFWQTQIRLTGYRAALREADIKASPKWVRPIRIGHHGSNWDACGYEQMNQWLDGDWGKLGCTALLCHNDEVAMGVLPALRERSIRVPEDLNVMGYDGTILCETARPRLCSIKVPLREIGARATALLIEQIETGHSDAVTLSLPATLQLGGSTSRLTISRP